MPGLRAFDARLPALKSVRQLDTHRLIPSQYSADGENVLKRLADDEEQLQDLIGLDRRTDDRSWGEIDWLPGISSKELVFGIPHAPVINATFTHAHPLGTRFSSSERGAWYAGFELETAQAEVEYHKTIEYGEIGKFEDSVTYVDFLADFSGEFHDIRQAPDFDFALNPRSYVESQELGQRLLMGGSLGIVYPSVRLPGGTCLACFRPALVGHVRRDRRYRFTWRGEPTPQITEETA